MPLKSASLASYVKLIHDFPDAQGVALESEQRTSWPDQGFEVIREARIFRFEDGARIAQIVEQDDFPSGLACAECWISYEVLSAPDSGVAVDPPKKTFDNHCRESYWLAWHTAP
ncbi:hypothetical protein [Niveibacterium terrae]|uniref:hypothetical protein n=1 Tax=Niveibacterium terrae TaxID=3373598 RepID=UPI003A8FA2E8